MKIGIVGAGNVGGTLGEAWAKRGHSVMFGVREPQGKAIAELIARCDGHGHAGSPDRAAGFGDVLVNALPWPVTKEVLSGLRLEGKVVFDATNPLLPQLAGLEVGTTTSGAELVAGWACGARVVKIFNTTGFGNMGNPIYQEERIPMLYCGDDSEAKAIAAGLANEIGFAAVDAGPLANARLLEPLAMLWIWLAHMGGVGPDFAFQIVKR